MTEARVTRRSLGAGLALALLLPLGWLLAHLPIRAGLWLGRRLGDLGWWVLPRRRAVTRDNLGRALGNELRPAELEGLARRSFEHLGMNLFEVCVLLFRPRSVVLGRLELAGHEHLDKAAAEGKGVLLLSAHLGNWELFAAAHALTAFELSVVVRPLDEPLLHRLAERLRQRSGVELIAKQRGLREVLEALRRGRLVGVLLDQNSSRAEGVFVPFFGVPASTSKGLAVISLRTGAPVVPVFIRRIGGGRHRVEFDAPVPRPDDGDVLSYTAAFNRAIESGIRRAPEQWFWMHERWRTRPSDVVTRRTLLAFASALAVLVAAGGVPPGAEDRREQVSPYLHALEARAVGEIAGRASGEPRRPSAPAAPYEGVSLLAFPYAADVDAHLDAIKRQQRDSIANYTEAHADVTAVREAYERELLAAGAGELIRGAVSDETGRLRLEGVPAGEWLLLGWREESHAAKVARTPSRDAGRFDTAPTMTGYGAVSYWRMRVSLRAGEATEVSLSDRSVWLTAVREQFTYPDEGVKKSGSYKNRR